MKNDYYNMGGDMRSLLGYSSDSPWRNAPYNLINTPSGKITMANTKKKLKAFDARTGKFLSNLEPGNEYQFDSDQVLEIPAYQQGGLLNDCPQGYIKDASGQCIEDNGYNPAQDNIKGTPTVPITNPAGVSVGGTGAIPGLGTGVNPLPPTPRKDPRPPLQNVINNSLIGVHAIHAGLSMFGNYLEEGKQKRWNQQQMAGINGTYSNAQNDYGVDPYEQTGQLRNPFAYGGIHINPANKGKFNALKARTGKSTEELTHSDNPLTRKRAIFAQNAAKWNHKEGGKFDAYRFLYGEDNEEITPAAPTSTPKKKQPLRITQQDIDESGFSPEDILADTQGRQRTRGSSDSSESAPSGFKSFGTYQEGKNALLNQLNLYKTGQTKTGLKPSSSLYEAMATYAPAADHNNPKQYAEFIANKLGISPNTPISAVDTQGWADAIEKMEGNKKGNNPGNLRPFQSGGQYNGVSIVDYLKSVGMSSSKSARRQLAKTYDVQNYNLSGKKNLELLAKVRQERMPSEGQALPVQVRPTTSSNPQPPRAVAPPAAPPPRFNLDPGNIPQAPAPNNNNWMLGALNQAVAPTKTSPIPTTAPQRSIPSGKSVTVPVGPNDIYNPLTNPNGYKPKLDKETIKALHTPANSSSSNYYRSQPNVDPDANDRAGIGAQGAQALIQNAKDVVTLAQNWYDRRKAKENPEDPTAISKLPTVAVANKKVLPPPIITGDTLRDDSRVYHIPMVADLNRIKMGTRSRNEGWNSQTPTDTEGMLFSTMGGFGNNMIDASKDKLEDDQVYVGADKEGNVKVGRGKEFKGQPLMVSKYPAQTITGFAKNADGTFKQSAQAYNKQHGFALMNTPNGEANTNLILRKKNKGNQQDESALYGRMAGGKIIIASPDFSKKIFVSGSVQSIDQQLEKFKKENNLNEVVYIMPDNGSQGRTYQTADKKMTGQDWRSLDLRDDSGGAGFYLKGKGYQQGGTFDVDEAEIERLTKLGYKIERL